VGLYSEGNEDTGELGLAPHLFSLHASRNLTLRILYYLFIAKMFQCFSLCPVQTVSKTLLATHQRPRPIPPSLLHNTVKIIVPYACGGLRPSHGSDTQSFDLQKIVDLEQGLTPGMNHSFRISLVHMRCKQTVNDLVGINIQNICCFFLFFMLRSWCRIYEGWNFNSGNYLFTTDTK